MSVYLLEAYTQNFNRLSGWQFRFPEFCAQFSRNVILLYFHVAERKKSFCIFPLHFHLKHTFHSKILPRMPFISFLTAFLPFCGNLYTCVSFGCLYAKFQLCYRPGFWYWITATFSPFSWPSRIMLAVPRLFPSQKAMSASATPAISALRIGPAALPWRLQSAG